MSDDFFDLSRGHINMKDIDKNLDRLNELHRHQRKFIIFILNENLNDIRAIDPMGIGEFDKLIEKSIDIIKRCISMLEDWIYYESNLDIRDEAIKLIDDSCECNKKYLERKEGIPADSQAASVISRAGKNVKEIVEETIKGSLEKRLVIRTSNMKGAIALKGMESKDISVDKIIEDNSELSVEDCVGLSVDNIVSVCDKAENPFYELCITKLNSIFY